MYLRVCESCHSKLEDEQVQAQLDDADAVSVTTSTWLCLNEVYSKIMQLQENIDLALPKVGHFTCICTNFISFC